MKWWSLRTFPQDMAMVSHLKLIMGAFYRALGESCLLSHKASSGGGGGGG